MVQVNLNLLKSMYKKSPRHRGASGIGVYMGLIISYQRRGLLQRSEYEEPRVPCGCWARQSTRRRAS